MYFYFSSKGKIRPADVLSDVVTEVHLVVVVWTVYTSEAEQCEAFDAMPWTCDYSMLLWLCC